MGQIWLMLTMLPLLSQQHTHTHTHKKKLHRQQGFCERGKKGVLALGDKSNKKPALYNYIEKWGPTTIYTKYRQ